MPMGPLVQAKIELRNPVTSAWSTLFRGFVSRIQWVPYQTEQWANVTLDLVDAMAIFAAVEMQDNADTLWGDDFIDGNIVFNEDSTGTLAAAQRRINKVLDQMGWPAGLREVSSVTAAVAASGALARGCGQSCTSRRVEH